MTEAPTSQDLNRPECSLIWEGTNPQITTVQTNNQKKGWKVIDVRSELEAKRILQEKGLGHLLLQILTHSKVRAEGGEQFSTEMAQIHE